MFLCAAYAMIDGRFTFRPSSAALPPPPDPYSFDTAPLPPPLLVEFCFVGHGCVLIFCPNALLIFTGTYFLSSLFPAVAAIIEIQ
jgi:hypothetical protein